MSNPPCKSFAQWKLERNMRQPPPQDNAATSAQPFPHSVDLLRNRNFLKPLGPFDGKVAAFAQLDYVPAIPSLETPHSVYLRSDMRYRTDDPTLWPPQFTDHYCHLAVIAKKGTRLDLAAMWWDPSLQDFVVGSAVTRGLGCLAPAWMSPIVDVVNRVIGRCKALEAKSSEPLLLLFGCTPANPRATPIPQKNPGKGYWPYAAEHKKVSAGPAKVDHNKFVALTVSEMSPLIDFAGLAVDTRYVLPEPALFANPDPQHCRRFLHHWKLLCDSFLFMPANRPQLLAPQQWWDVLEGHMTKRGLPDSRSYRQSKELEDVILEALEVSNVKSIEGFPVPNKSLPEFSLGETQEIIWDVTETSLRFEFCALDRRASGQTRVDEVKKCFAGRMLVGLPLEMSKQGWASTSLEEHHVFVGRTATLMLDWVTKSHPPKIIRCIIDRCPWSTTEMQDLENAVCWYYT
ncbi:hypothetical protein B0H14DRAFT_2558348 [Mycena olivaceomarginata]|nr:hypothetical protein B0H14DRAFT_2558348 [Mycena olivaceomarginata]